MNPFVLIAVLLPTVLFCMGASNHDQWTKIRNVAEGITSIKADFVQEKHLKILTKPLIAKGVFFYQAPDSIRFEYRSPIQNLLLMDKGKMKRYVERDGKLVEDVAASAQSMNIVLPEITRWMKGRFDENPFFKAVLAPDQIIVLTPKEKNLSALIQKIELKVATQQGIIERVTIYESEDSYTRLNFNDIKLNQKLDQSIFREKRVPQS